MSKEYLSYDEQLLSSGGVHLSSAGDDFLLMVISLEDFQLRASNHMAANYFRSALEEGGPQELFSRTIHPEDQLHFKRFLRSSSQLEQKEEREIMLRLRSPFGYWKKFQFKVRPYQGLGKIRQILALGTPLEPRRARFRRSPSQDLGTERSLQESLNRYKVLVNSLDKGYAIVELIYDLHGCPKDYLFVEVNPAFERQTNLAAAVGQTANEVLELREPHLIETFGRVAASATAERFESYSRAHQAWFDIYAFPIGRKSSRRVATLFADISARKEAELSLKRLNENLEYTVRKRTEELQEKNELLQMVFDTSSHGIFIMKPVFGPNYDIVDFTYVRVNRKVNRYYRREMIGRRFLELNPAATESGAFEIFKQTLLTGKSREFEVPLTHQGKKNWFKVTCRRQKGLVFSTLKNITRKKQQAEKFKENLRFKKQLIETSPDVILIVDLYKEVIRYINKDISAHPFMRRSKINSLPLSELLLLIHPQDRKKAIEFHKALMLASDRDILELEFRMRGSERAWDFFGARGKVFRRNSKSNVCEYILLLRNIQEQKQTQQALINAEKLSIKGEIARTLAHELRNPLASIGMSADIMKTKTGSHEEYRCLDSYVEIIKRSTKTLNSLVTDLLTVSNYSPLSLKRCCLAEATDRALELAQDRIYLAGVKVINAYVPPLFILGDIEKLQIALLNIIVNASEAMTPDQGILEIVIEEKQDDYCMRISDNGCGMEQEQLDNLFDSFYTRKPGGMGIGLSSVKNILEDHAASISVQSQPHQGTTFLLIFPKYREDAF